MGEVASPNNSNLTRYMTILTMESLGIPPSTVYFTFIFGILTYCLILFFHSLLLVTIVVKQNLHEPMYILLFNLSICDLMGATGFYPQLVYSVLSQNREISYAACVLQGFLIHLYATGSPLFLTVMSYDRYIAICKPLRYHNLMTPGTLVKFICMVWFINFDLNGTLFLITTSKKICRTNIVDTLCSNPPLMKLSCEDMTVPNYYGLFITAVTQGSPILVVSLTYIRILITCLFTKQTKSVSKALHTAGTHLVVFLTFEVNIMFTLIAHRLEGASPHLRRAFGVSVVIFPPLLNPLIYGLKTREIRQSVFSLLQKSYFYLTGNYSKLTLISSLQLSK